MLIEICQSDTNSPASTAACFFSIALCLGSGSSFGPRWQEGWTAWSANTNWRPGCLSWHFRSHYNAVCRDGVAKRNRTIHATASEIAAAKPDLDEKAKKNTILRHLRKILKRKITSAKINKICWQFMIAALMHLLQYDLRCPAAKDTSITYAAAVPSNLDAAITMRSAETELQNTIEIRATASKLQLQNRDVLLDAKAKKRRFWSTF